MGLPFCIFVLFFHLHTLTAETTCSTSKNDGTRQAIVTCDFHKDIRATKQSFTVYRYPPNTTIFDSITGTQVLACSWSADYQTECYVGTGYEFDLTKKVETTATLYTKGMAKIHEGLYECQLGPGSGTSSPSSSTPCNLALSDLDFLTVSDASKQESSKAESSSIAAIVLAAILAIGITAVVAVVIRIKCVNGPSAWKKFRDLMVKVGSPDPEHEEQAGRLLELNTNDQGVSSRPLPPLPSTVTTESQVSPSTATNGTQTIPKPEKRKGEKGTQCHTEPRVQPREQPRERPTVKEDLDLDGWSYEHVKEWLAEKSLEQYKRLLEINGKKISGLKLQQVAHIKQLMDRDTYNFDRTQAERLKAWIEQLKQQDLDRKYATPRQ